MSRVPLHHDAQDQIIILLMIWADTHLLVAATQMWGFEACVIVKWICLNFALLIGQNKTSEDVKMMIFYRQIDWECGPKQNLTLPCRKSPLRWLKSVPRSVPRRLSVRSGWSEAEFVSPSAQRPTPSAGSRPARKPPAEAAEPHAEPRDPPASAGCSHTATGHNVDWNIGTHARFQVISQKERN